MDVILDVIVGKQVQFIGLMFFVLILFITADIISGWLKGWHTGKLDSAKNFKGYIRKVTIILLALLAVALDLVVAVILLFLQMDNVTMLGLNIAEIPLIAVIMLGWLLSGELLSIIENMSEMGVRMPKFLEKGIRRVNNNIDEGNINVKTVAKKSSKEVTVETKITKKGDVNGNL